MLSWPTGDPAILSARRSVLIAPNPGAKADMPRGPRWVQKQTSALPYPESARPSIVLQKSIFADDQNSAGRGRDFLVQDVRDLTASRKIHRRLR